MRQIFFRLSVLFFISISVLSCHADQTSRTDPLRLQKMVKRFYWQDAKNSYPQNALLFIGSSSIYRWKTAQAFPRQHVINRGIPGAEIADINFFYPELVGKYSAQSVVFYCGDNDVASGKSSTQILTDFKTFTRRLKAQTNHPTLFYLAIKPSPQRWQLWDKMIETNLKIQEYCRKSHQCTFIDTATVLLNDKGQPDKKLFGEDELHLNDNGYQLWNELLYSVLPR